jgi:type I restriction enzyme, S subunit
MAADGWRQAALGEVSENFDRVRVPLSSREREQRRGSIPYYGAAGVIDWVADSLLDGKYLLVGEDGSVETEGGRPVLQLTSGKFWVNNHAHVLRGRTDAETRYLYYALSTVGIHEYLSGSVQPKLTQENLNRIEVPFPPETERRTIASVLGSLDDKIELHHRMNRTLEQIAQVLFKSWFVGFDPVRAKAEGRWKKDESLPTMPADMWGHWPSEFEESEIGEIPRGWSVSEIGRVVTVAGGSTPSTTEPRFWDGAIHWATPKDMARLTAPALLDTERKLSGEGLAETTSGLLSTGTVLLSSRAPIGYLAITEVPVAVNQGFITMTCGTNPSNHYMLHWARENHEAILGQANGTTFLEISKSNFRPMKILVPTGEIMNRFTHAARTLHEKVVANLRQIDTLATTRDTLLPRLLSGEIRVMRRELE